MIARWEPCRCAYCTWVREEQAAAIQALAEQVDRLLLGDRK